MRINSRLRTFNNTHSSILEIGGLSLDQKSYRTSVDGNAVTLGPTEFRLLRRLRKALEPFNKACLIQTVRGAGYRFSTRA